MIVYHGSSQIIEAPDISFSKNYLDFGKGFYLTTFKKQAEKWAERKASRYRGEPIVNEYELSDDLSSFSVLKFDNENEKWLDFVCSCRNGQQLDKNYDIIYKQNLETNIIEYLATTLNINLRDAMDKYYSSKLAKQIETGENGIDNLDYKNLAEDLIENEIYYAKFRAGQ